MQSCLVAHLCAADRMEQLKASGATSVVLGPVMMGPGAVTSSGAPPLDGSHRTPLALFSADPALAVGGPLSAPSELKTVVQALHAAGLEVLFEVRPRGHCWAARVHGAAASS